MIRIMIADDEEVIRRGLEKITSRMDVEVEVIGSYGNGLEAWNHLSAMSSGDLDLLITDIKMPRMDGFKLIEEARGHMKNLPIAVLSGFNDFEYARRAIRFGVMDYLLEANRESPVIRTAEAGRGEQAAEVFRNGTAGIAGSGRQGTSRGRTDQSDPGEGIQP